MESQVNYFVVEADDMYSTFAEGEISESDQQAFKRVLEAIYSSRENNGKPPLQTLVIEKSWPEYGPALAALKARIGAQSAFNAAAQESQQGDIKQSVIPDMQQEGDVIITNGAVIALEEKNGGIALTVLFFADGESAAFKPENVAHAIANNAPHLISAIANDIKNAQPVPLALPIFDGVNIDTAHLTYPSITGEDVATGADRNQRNPDGAIGVASSAIMGSMVDLDSVPRFNDKGALINLCDAIGLVSQG